MGEQFPGGSGNFGQDPFANQAQDWNNQALAQQAHQVLRDMPATPSQDPFGFRAEDEARYAAPAIGTPGANPDDDPWGFRTEANNSYAAPVEQQQATAAPMSRRERRAVRKAAERAYTGSAPATKSYDSASSRPLFGEDDDYSTPTLSQPGSGFGAPKEASGGHINDDLWAVRAETDRYPSSVEQQAPAKMGFGARRAAKKAARQATGSAPATESYATPSSSSLFGEDDDYSTPAYSQPGSGFGENRQASTPAFGDATPAGWGSQGANAAPSNFGFNAPHQAATPGFGGNYAQPAPAAQSGFNSYPTQAGFGGSTEVEPYYDQTPASYSQEAPSVRGGQMRNVLNRAAERVTGGVEDVSGRATEIYGQLPPEAQSIIRNAGGSALRGAVGGAMEGLQDRYVKDNGKVRKFRAARDIVTGNVVGVAKDAGRQAVRGGIQGAREGAVQARTEIADMHPGAARALEVGQAGYNAYQQYR